MGKEVYFQCEKKTKHNKINNLTTKTGNKKQKKQQGGCLVFKKKNIYIYVCPRNV